MTMPTPLFNPIVKQPDIPCPAKKRNKKSTANKSIALLRSPLVRGKKQRKVYKYKAREAPTVLSQSPFPMKSDLKIDIE